MRYSRFNGRNIKFVKAAVPEALIPKSYASGSAVAWVMYQKFANAMPLYRQEQDWHQLGVDFIRAIIISLVSGDAPVGRIQDDTSLAYRLEKEKPILDAFWNWLDEQKPRKGSRFETAVKYAQNRKDTLMTYLLEHRPSEDMSDEQLEALIPWSEEVQNVCKN